MAQKVSFKFKPATALYGISGSVKTFLAASHPRRRGSRIAYICPDPGALGLDSFSAEDREAVDLFIPDGDFDPKAPEKMDWRLEAYNLAQKKWEAEGDYGLLIVDHGSVWAEEFVKESARKNWFSEKGPVTGNNDPKRDAAAKYKVPQQGDYGIAQNLLVEVVNNFVRHQDIPQVWIFQEIFDEKLGWFGPRACGAKGPALLPNLFGSCLWLSRDVTSGNPKGDLVISLTNREKHIAKISSNNPEKIPETMVIPKSGGKSAMEGFWKFLYEVKGFGVPWEAQVAAAGAAAVLDRT